MLSASDADERPSFYSEPVEAIREREYPALKGTTYLDHAGTTVPSVSLISAFAERMTTNLYGNPHSASSAAQLSSRQADDARVRVLKLFNADPNQFDVVFVANATAGIKLVAEGMHDYFGNGFDYRYLVDSHTSSVGVRGSIGNNASALEDDAAVHNFIARLKDQTDGDSLSNVILFEYPAQSNMTGRRYPLKWCKEIREATLPNSIQLFSLLDAASYVATSSLDLSDTRCDPDFTILSFYKSFGFPDLGALIVRKESAYIFSRRKYFGGGTADMITVPNSANEKPADQWHIKKKMVHDSLEDGTLPIHNIVALHAAMDSHERLYGSMENVSRHTSWLSKYLHDQMMLLRHANGRPLVKVYKDSHSSYGESLTQGPIVTFNLQTKDGHWIGKSDVEKTAAVKDIQLRTGTLCNPGAMSRALNLSADEMRMNFEAGQRCGDDNDILFSKPTGAVRVSLGAMSTVGDVKKFIGFLREFYLEKDNSEPVSEFSSLNANVTTEVSVSSCVSHFFVKKLCVYPIKSCGAFEVPASVAWPVTAEGLAWDRTWCLVHQGTGAALNQKRYPRMALIKPILDEATGTMRVQLCAAAVDSGEGLSVTNTLDIKLSDDDDKKSLIAVSCSEIASKTASRVCGENINLLVYSVPEVASFFSEFLGVPCTLAKFPGQHSYMRSTRVRNLPGRRVQASDTVSTALQGENARQNNSYQLRLSNESPMLLVSQSSVDHINSIIRSNNDNMSPIPADVFRANIVVEERVDIANQHPFLEDCWSQIRVHSPSEPSQPAEKQRTVELDVLGSCQRCQMICIDQATAVRGQEPFATLAKTRKTGGKILFGRHVGLSAQSLENSQELVMISAGDEVIGR